MYFIGVSTGRSSIMKVFPRWAEYLGISDAKLKGIDFPLHAESVTYRAAVEFIRSDNLSQGALVTTHKIDLFSACLDLFDEVDPHARRLGVRLEIGYCLARRRSQRRIAIASGQQMQK